MPGGWVKKLARKYLNNPLTIDLVGDRDEKLAEGIKLYAILATPTSKRTILSDLIMVYAKGGKTIIFMQTKRDADEVAMALTNSIASEALHGDISQHQRERTLNGFRQGKFTVLVATDVAARGLDIPNVDLIIHYELPNDPETFVRVEQDVQGRKSIEFFIPTAQKLIDEKGVNALASALAHLSGFSQHPSSRSLINHEQGWVTLQLARDSAYSRGFLSARSVTGFLSDVYPAAADELGKIYLVADEKVLGKKRVLRFLISLVCPS
ncbi:hypothetical protein SAY86_027633 [Trapa natans]|uniref:RNA helicase n=1 Tax=Trapa natans TaxID=22666 RepID=A0AAN7KHV1_TRANT|nr:hypothetical protein SAY86_027633 [Trapa natans]